MNIFRELFLWIIRNKEKMHAENNIYEAQIDE